MESGRCPGPCWSMPLKIRHAPAHAGMAGSRALPGGRENATFVGLRDIFAVSDERGLRHPGHARRCGQPFAAAGIEAFQPGQQLGAPTLCLFRFSVLQHPSSLMEQFDPDVYRSTHTYEPIT